MTAPQGAEGPEDREPQGPIIHDKRRIDPVTGLVRERETPPAPGPVAAEPTAPEGEQPETTAPAAPDGPDLPAQPVDPLAELQARLDERTADLQRLQAEYANYRRRIERDRVAIRDIAVAGVLTTLLPVLDDIGRAREHGELEGGFKSVADTLEGALERLGLSPFGAVGDAFDPTVHEALTHAHSDEVTEPTCVQIFQPGYRIGDRVVRPARVGVADPEE